MYNLFTHLKCIMWTVFNYIRHLIWRKSVDRNNIKWFKKMLRVQCTHSQADRQCGIFNIYYIFYMICINFFFVLFCFTYCCAPLQPYTPVAREEKRSNAYEIEIYFPSSIFRFTVNLHRKRNVQLLWMKICRTSQSSYVTLHVKSFEWLYYIAKP